MVLEMNKRSFVEEVEMIDEDEEDEYEKPVDRTQHPGAKSLRKAVPRSYDRSSGRAKNLPCSCLDCCPCITNVTSAVGLWGFYCLHLIFALKIFSNCMNDEGGNIVFVGFHLLSSHMYVKAIHLQRPPSMLMHCFSVVMVCLQIIYQLNLKK